MASFLLIFAVPYRNEFEFDQWMKLNWFSPDRCLQFESQKIIDQIHKRRMGIRAVCSIRPPVDSKKNKITPKSLLKAGSSAPHQFHTASDQPVLSAVARKA